jgi:dimethylhistidine N-methyltransferase
LLDALLRPSSYICIDISPVPLAANAERVARRYPDLPVSSICGNYLEPMLQTALSGYDASAGRDICFFPGSTIGNFERQEARAFLAAWRGQLAHGAMMLVGVDLKKDVATLERAYDDARGVTARFSLNVLERANRELGAGFDVGNFRHRARYIDTPGHIEISLVSQRMQHVLVAGHSFALAEGEAIHIENSHKYGIEEFGVLAGQAGFAVDAVWTDAAQRFSLHLLRAAA